jgi:hypothetical protein
MISVGRSAGSQVGGAGAVHAGTAFAEWLGMLHSPRRVTQALTGNLCLRTGCDQMQSPRKLIWIKSDAEC